MFVTALQFAEELSDRQAAEAVRDRIDRKYALGLELDDSRFDSSVLCEVRARLPAGPNVALVILQGEPPDPLPLTRPSGGAGRGATRQG